MVELCDQVFAVPEVASVSKCSVSGEPNETTLPLLVSADEGWTIADTAMAVRTNIESKDANIDLLDLMNAAGENRWVFSVERRGLFRRIRVLFRLMVANLH